jgi:hypothetical protein
MAGVPTIEHASTRAQSERNARPAPGTAWLGGLADTVDVGQQRLARKLAALVGSEAGLLLMLPILLMLRPVLALARSLQHSRLLLLACLLIVLGGIVAGPSVGTRFGLILVPIYVLGWVCALNNLRAQEAVELARIRLARAGRLLRRKLVPMGAPHVTPDRRN